MRGMYSLLVVLLFAVACTQQPSTSPSPLPRAQQPGSSNFGTTGTSNFAFDTFVDDLEEPDDQGLCSRSGGFWCQNQNGQNPNLTPEEWEVYLSDAVALLEGQGVATSEKEVAEAVCDVRRQLFRQLAALALNLAAGFVDPMEPLIGEADTSLLTVGDAFVKGAAIYNQGDAASFKERPGDQGHDGSHQQQRDARE